MDNLNIVAFIPARSGSKSIPDKNIKELGGKPLIAYSIESAFNAGIKKVVVDTDSQEYAQIARQYGAEVMIRPNHLAKDNTSMFEVLRTEIPRTNADLVLLLQPTSPFRNKNHILLAIEYLQANLDKYDSLVSVELVPEKYNPAVVIIQTPTGKGMVMAGITSLKEKLGAIFNGKTWKQPNLSGYPISHRITQRQQNPVAWVPTGSIYLFKAKNLEGGSIYGKDTMLLETEPQININSQDDWTKAEQYLINKNK